MKLLTIITEVFTCLGVVILIWYAWETRKLRIIANNQKDLEILPLPFIFIRGTSVQDNFLMIKNLGRGTSVATRIESFKIDDNGVLKFDIGQFSSPRDFSGNLLQPCTEQDPRTVFISYSVGEANKSTKLSNSKFYEYFAADGKYIGDKGRELTIAFRDIQNNVYEIKEHFSKDGPIITQLPKRVDEGKFKKIKASMKSFA